MKYLKNKKKLYRLKKTNQKANIIIKTQESQIEKLSLNLEKAIKNNNQKLEFISHLSHELKTPLNAILGFASLMQESELPREKQIRYCQNILSASKHLLHLSEYTIDLARAETNNLELNYSEFCPTEIINEIISILEEQIVKKHLKITTNLDNQPIVADKRRFKQLVYNLLGNAIKFNLLGGFIKIDTKIKQNKFYFSIEDTGIGIQQDAQGKIFELFSNIHNKNYTDEDSHGIGLSLCKKIVNLHNGEINFVSLKNNGTKFWFILPTRILCEKNNSTEI